MLHLYFEGKDIGEIKMIRDAIGNNDCVSIEERDNGYDIFIGSDTNNEIQMDMLQYVIWKRSK